MSTGKRNIKAVTFDLWETLLFERDGASSRRNVARCENLARTLNKLGLEISLEQVTSALKETTSALANIWDKNKDVTHLDQIQLIIKHALNDSTTVKKEWIDELSLAYVSPILEVPPYLNPDTRKVLSTLKKRGKLIGLICNTGLTPGSALRDFLAGEGVAKYFDLMIFSDEVGVRKPDPRMFHLVAKRSGVKPCEVVHIGDNLRIDVWGAKNAGSRAIHFSSEKGRDIIAESDSTSLVSISRCLGTLRKGQMIPDRVITSLPMVIKAVHELET
jgi:putative hydrolase of the HAD superfamily